MTDRNPILSSEHKTVRECLNKIWELTRMNQGIRDGEKQSVMKNLKEIDFMWEIGKL